MYITYLGHSCFKIQDKTGPDAVTIITDPFDSKIVGYKTPSHEAEVVTISHGHPDHNNVGAIRGNPFIVDTAGEYDIKGISIEGIDSFHDGKEGKERGTNIIYRIIIDDITVVHLGDLGQTALDAKQLEKLESTDVLMIPVGGYHTIDAKQAVEIISQIEPRIVIPMHYKNKESKSDKLEGVDKFIKEMGITPKYEEKLKINKKDLPQEDTELVILSV